MVKRRDEVYFGQGWAKFVEDNRLRDGDVLTFVYDGSRSFTVDIYGGSRACKEVRAVAHVISVDDDDDDDKEDTNPSSEPAMAQTVPSARNQEDSTIIEPEVAQRVPRTRNKGKKGVVVQDSDDSFMSEDSDSLSDDSSYSPLNEDTLLDVTPKVTNSRKKGKLRSVSSNVGSTSNSSRSVSRKRPSTIKNPEVYLDDPNNVCFETTVKKRIYDLSVPSQIVRDYCLKFQDYVYYIDNHERGMLEARVATWHDYRVSIKKWERICQRNGLTKGDSFLCELFRKEGLVYAVKIHVVTTTS